LRRDVRDFRTDRVLKVQLQNEVFSEHTDFSLKRYLEERRSCDGNFEMARIRFKPEAMDRVRRERHWGLVEEEAGRDGVDATLLDFSLEWLARWVLSFGSMAQVLAPERLKQLVAAEAEHVAAQYAPIRSARRAAPGRWRKHATIPTQTSQPLINDDGR
jgi:predicted DNA-binding transcriptional regulator YafY